MHAHATSAYNNKRDMVKNTITYSQRQLEDNKAMCGYFPNNDKTEYIINSFQEWL